MMVPVVKSSGMLVLPYRAKTQRKANTHHSFHRGIKNKTIPWEYQILLAI